MWTTAIVVGAEVCAALDDGARAHTIYELLLPFRDQFTVLGPLLTCGGAIARTLGQMATVLGRWSDAEVHFDAALAANRAASAEPFVVLTQRDLARMLFARGGPGDQERAERLHHEARSAACAMGMAPMSAIL